MLHLFTQNADSEGESADISRQSDTSESPQTKPPSDGSGKRGLKRFFRFGVLFRIILLPLILVIILRTFVIEASKIPTSSMENTLLPGDFMIVNKLAYGARTPEYLPFSDIPLPVFRMPGYAIPQRNDVVVFQFPGEKNSLYPQRDVYYVKRIVAGPGDTLQITDKALFVNGERVGLPPTAKFTHAAKPRGQRTDGIFPPGSGWNEDNYGPVIVPAAGSVMRITHDNLERFRMLINRELGKYAVEFDSVGVSISGVRVDTYTITKNYYFMLGDNRDDSYDSRFWGFIPEDAVVGKASFIYWSVNPFEPGFLGSIRFGRIFTAVD